MGALDGRGRVVLWLEGVYSREHSARARESA